MSLTSIRYGKHAVTPDTGRGTIKAPPFQYKGKHRLREGLIYAKQLTVADIHDPTSIRHDPTV